jgi:ribose transport system substrate-binding protein
MQQCLSSLLRWTGVLLCVGGTLAVAGCGDSQDTATGATTKAKDKPVRIAYFGLAAANSFTQYSLKAGQDEAKKRGATLQFFDGEFNPTKQAQQVTDATASGKFDAYIIAPNDSAGIVPAARKAMSKGIKVSAFHFFLGSDMTKNTVDGLTSSAVEDVVKGAEASAEGIIAACEGVDPCEVGLLWGIRAAPWDAAKVKPLKDELRNYPNIKIIGEGDGGFLAAGGQKLAADFLSAHPKLNVLAAFSDQELRGAERAITRAGRAFGNGDGEVRMVGYGGTQHAIEQIRAEKWRQTFVITPDSGLRLLVDQLVDAVRGKPVAQELTWDHELSPVGGRVTKDILDKKPSFIGEWDG